MGGRGQIDAFGDFKYWGGISEECVLGVLWYLRKKSDSVEVVQRTAAEKTFVGRGWRSGVRESETS